MKRILLISRCPPYPLYLGDRLIVWHLMRELEARHYQIDLLAFADRPEDWDEIGKYDMYFGQVELFPMPVSRMTTYMQRVLMPKSRFPRHASQARSPEMFSAIQRLVTENNYDLVHFFGGVQVYEYAQAIGRLPALITPYESYSLYLRRLIERETPLTPGKLATYAQQFFARRFESWMFAPYQNVVVVSERDREELLSLNPTMRVEVIPNGIDLYNFRLPRVRRRAKALLFVGNYEYAPNVDAALLLAREILPQVRQQMPDVRLWLVGNAPPPALQALAGDHIKVTGRVPDVRPYLARASVFACPLRFGAGIKNKVLEALAMGLPVVATPLSVDGIHVEHERDVLIAEVEDFAAGITRLLRDKDLQAGLAEQGRALIEKEYSWSQVAMRYIGLYDRLAEKGSE
ncbi:MAG: glycosyltransferase family 4 protein [Anaerolineae bacterium]|nr:glycosyltransferase family 4 protein [Anaerolineae bacterium]